MSNSSGTTTIYWQIYERIKTGELVKFRLIRPGVYVREDGIEFNVVKLRMYYQWAKAANKPTQRPKYVITPNGFSVRVNANRSYT